MMSWSPAARSARMLSRSVRRSLAAKFDVENLEAREVPSAVAAAPINFQGTTGTGLDKLVTIITTDPGLRSNITTDQILAGAQAADGMDKIIVNSVKTLGIANDGNINTADVRDLSTYIHTNFLTEWTTFHGDDEDGVETGFHLVQGDGGRTKIFGQMAIDTVLDGIYHLGFGMDGDNLINEDGDDNASVRDVAAWLNSFLGPDLAKGTLSNPAANPYANATTGTGLDILVGIISKDRGLNDNLPTSQITAGAKAADAMNVTIVEAIKALGLANDGVINAADVRDISAYIITNHATEWAALHGDDDGGVETGFHLVQGDGGRTKLFGQMAVDTVMDGIYHLGFGIDGDRLINEDGDNNACVRDVAAWMNALLKPDLAKGTLANAAVDPYIHGTTGTGLDSLISVINADMGLNRNIATSQIRAGATSANAMNGFIIEAIKATGVANDGTITAADVRDISRYIAENHADAWLELHGDDEGGVETGFHLIQGDGGTSRLFGQAAVNTVMDGIYHLGFGIDGDRLINEDGDANATVRSVADWLSRLLAADLANGSLANPDVVATVQGTTGTGLDRLVTIINTDVGLQRNISTSQIAEGARSANGMSQIIIDSIKALGIANDGVISISDLRDLSLYIVTNYGTQWAALHGDDEGGVETGFHAVQGDGGTTRLFDRAAINTVMDGIFHLGFGYDGDRLINEDGDSNACLKDVASWMNQLLANDFAKGTLVNSAVNAYAVGTTGTGIDRLVNIIASDPGLNARLATSQITDAARAADAMGVLIVEAVKATGAAADGSISAADIRAISDFLVSRFSDQWATLHGSSEGGVATGFHQVRCEGASTQLFGVNAVNHVADAIYHLGFPVNGNNLTNENGDANASLDTVAMWLNSLFAADFAAGTLV